MHLELDLFIYVFILPFDRFYLVLLRKVST